MAIHSDMKWYYSPCEEFFTGPFETRDEAILNGMASYDDVGFCVAQASNPPVKLSDWIPYQEILEYAEASIFDNDRASYEYDGDGIFNVTPSQEKDLKARIKKACDEWQADNGISFSCSTFYYMSAPEWIGGVV